MEISGPVRHCSIRRSPGPKRRFSRTSATKASASDCSVQTATPLPAARPSNLRTMGSVVRETAASAGVVATLKSAVGMA
jgi:hypothetical protein